MFTFKKFTVEDDSASMKVGTDAVLLGAWSNVSIGTCLEVGCGCGVISMMLAQRAPQMHITGIDIHLPSVEQATRNATRNRFNQIQFVLADYRNYAPSHQYNYIVSNPPYHLESLQAATLERAQARSESSLPFPSFVEKSARLLQSAGHLQVILPVRAEEIFHTLCLNFGLFLCRKTYVQTTKDKQPKRVLLDYVKCKTEKAEVSTIILMDEHGMRSKTYSTLCRDFYI